MAKKKSKKKKSIFPKELVNRARKIGLSTEMIETYPNAIALKAKCDSISPKTNPAARPKTVSSPGPAMHPEQVPDKYEFTSYLEAQFFGISREQHDNQELQAALRLVNRKYGASEPVKTRKTETCKPVSVEGKDGKYLVTEYVIFYK